MVKSRQNKHLEIDNLVRESVKNLKPKAPRRKSNEDAIYLDKGELPFPPSPKVCQAISDAISQVNRYPEIMGGELREMLADYTGAGKEQIVISNGSDDAIELILKAFVQSGEEVLLPTPTFFVYAFSTELIGGKVISVPRLDNFDLNVKEILEQVTAKTKVLFIANPNNPTANLVSREKLIALIEQTNCLVVVDECYYEFCGETIVDLVDQYNNLIVLRSFSKSFGLAGLRIGYAITNETVADYLYRAAQIFPVNKLALVGACAALDDLNYIRDNITKICQEKFKLAKALEEFGLRVYPSDTNFLFIKTESIGLTSREIVESLAQKQIFIADFGLKQGLNSYFVRISVGTAEENNKLLERLGDLSQSKSK